MQYAGADWLERNGKTLSPFGRKVADIVGAVWRGIYHIQDEVCRADWSDGHAIKLNIYARHGGLATWDSNDLTELVVLCHDACIRLDIQACNPLYLRLVFTPRVRDGLNVLRHPTIEEAIESARKVLAC